MIILLRDDAARVCNVPWFGCAGAGVQWSNINQASSVDDSFTMLQVIHMPLSVY